MIYIYFLYIFTLCFFASSFIQLAEEKKKKKKRKKGKIIENSGRGKEHNSSDHKMNGRKVVDTCNLKNHTDTKDSNT